MLVLNLFEFFNQTYGLVVTFFVQSAFCYGICLLTVSSVQ